jgi:hypothetical protein
MNNKNNEAILGTIDIKKDGGFIIKKSLSDTLDDDDKFKFNLIVEFFIFALSKQEWLEEFYSKRKEKVEELNKRKKRKKFKLIKND